MTQTLAQLSSQLEQDAVTRLEIAGALANRLKADGITSQDVTLSLGTDIITIAPSTTDP